MRLLIINHEYRPVGAGAANASEFLARTLAQRGYDVSVVTSAFRKHRGLSVEDGVRVHRIPALRTKIDRTGVAQMLCFAASALVLAPGIARAERVERVISYFTLPSGLVAYCLKVRLRLPYVVSLRGGDVPGLVPGLELTHRAVRWLRRRILRSALAIVANSQGLANLSEAADPCDVEVIPNGVDSDLFRPSEADPPVDSGANFHILFAGRFQEQKNLGLLLDELARLRREGVTEMRLAVAGDGPLAAAMREHAGHLDLGGCVTWHGWVAKRELISLYQSADCFVNPSRYEGHPNTVLEAMACGLPVVASRVDGNKDLVVESETGLLFDLHEPRELGSGLEYLAQHRDVARSMGAAGRARAVEEYSWDQAAERYLELLPEGSGGFRPS